MRSWRVWILELWRERRCEVRDSLNSDCITMSFLVDSAGEARAAWADGMVTLDMIAPRDCSFFIAARDASTI